MGTKTSTPGDAVPRACRNSGDCSPPITLNISKAGLTHDKIKVLPSLTPNNRSLDNGRFRDNGRRQSEQRSS